MELPRPKIVAESWRTSHEYQILRDACKARGHRVTFVNGCFDLMHSGHVRMLHHVAREVARLSCWNYPGPFVVGLNSDASVARLKGPGRPVLNWAERACVLSALGVVDAVVGFDEDTATELVRDLKPRFYGKGGDYVGKPVPEVEALPDGAAVIFAPRGEIALTDMSSTKMIATIIGAEATRVQSLPGSWSPLQAAFDSVARARAAQSGGADGGRGGDQQGG